MHHILNEYRPHQARESAIALLQDRLDRTRADTADIRSKTEMARKALEGLASIETPKPFRSVLAPAEEDVRIKAQLRQTVEAAVWDVLDDV